MLICNTGHDLEYRRFRISLVLCCVLDRVLSDSFQCYGIMQCPRCIVTMLFVSTSSYKLMLFKHHKHLYELCEPLTMQHKICMHEFYELWLITLDHDIAMNYDDMFTEV